MAEASNGAEFLDLLKNITPDLVILDINMPVMNGIEAAKKAIAHLSRPFHSYFVHAQ